MNRFEFLRALDELLELEPGTLTGDEKLEGLEGWGSLALLGYMALVNENFGLIVSPVSMSACQTVDDLYGLTARQLKPS